MQSDKKVKDLMVGIFEYPHIPYWFSIEQVIRIVKISFLSSKKYPYPLVIMVFDEKYNLLGTVTLKEILKGIEPRLSSPITKAQDTGEDQAGLSIILDAFFKNESRELIKKPIKEIMVPVKFFVEPDDPITKAVYLIIHHDLPLLPVLEEKKKFVGIVRMIEVFDELSNVILKE